MSRFRRNWLGGALALALLALSLLAPAAGVDAFTTEEIEEKCRQAQGNEDYYGTLLWDAYDDNDPSNDAAADDKWLEKYQYWVGQIGKWC